MARLTLPQSCHENATIMSATAKIQNQVRLHRAARNWSQQELATRAGISRAEVSAIETGRLLPSIATALALSQAFQCRLEDLFQAQAESARAPDWAWHPESDRCRFWQAEVGSQTLLYPAETAFPWAPPHDGVSEFGVLRFRSQVPPTQTLVLAGCDPAAGLLAAEYARTTDQRLLVLPRSSGAAIDLFAARRVHLAGLHLHSPGQGNASVVRQKLGPGHALIHVARWQEGLALAPHLKLPSVDAVLRSRVRWIGREPGSGARQCLDELRQGKGTLSRLARDHRSVAEAIRSGWADAGVCVRLASEEAGLRFLAVREEAYDLVCPVAELNSPRVVSLLQVLRSAEYRRLLGELPGYDTTETGGVQHVD
ncbi:MAG: substrate-binding domain-containing protein [Planctomycetaceae bacterium]